MTTVYDFSAKTITGEDKKLADYRGEVLLIVNVASRCGYTPQYKGLEELHREHHARGFEVLGFPCNQFGAQEPGTEEEIKTFCESRYDVTFPLFRKVDVNGPSAAPLYAHLTTQQTKPEGAGPIAWNFGKFLVGRDGQVLARFPSKTAPTDPALLEALERALDVAR